MPNNRTRLPLPEPRSKLIGLVPPFLSLRYDAIQMYAYSDAECAPLMKEIEALRQGGSKLTADNAALRERVKVLEDALKDALVRMDRARGILTDGKPRPECNWGMLATEAARAALEAK